MSASITSPAERAAMLPPPKPDPLLDALNTMTVTGQVVAVATSPAEEPGAAELAEVFSDTKPEPPASTVAPELELTSECAHAKVPPSKLEKLGPGKSIVCPDCKEDLKNPEAEA